MRTRPISRLHNLVFTPEPLPLVLFISSVGWGAILWSQLWATQPMIAWPILLADHPAGFWLTMWTVLPLLRASTFVLRWPRWYRTVGLLAIFCWSYTTLELCLGQPVTTSSLLCGIMALVSLWSYLRSQIGNLYLLPPEPTSAAPTDQ